MGRILALDIGEKRVGLAISDELKMIASPLTFVEFAKLDDEISRVMAGYGIDEIVVGLPRNMDGTEGSLAGFVRGVAERIEKVANEEASGEEKSPQSVILAVGSEAQARRATPRRPESENPGREDDSGPNFAEATQGKQARMTQQGYSNVILVDETLTSVEAESRLRERKKSYSKGDIDAEAAAVILENYLKENYVE